LAESKVLDNSFTIVRGYFNLTLSSREIWGIIARLDNLKSFFTSFFENVKLVDLEPVKLVPIWRNFRSGDMAIGKHLDRFLVSGDLLSSHFLFRYWVFSTGLFDHLPIIFQMDVRTEKTPTPFMFNPI